MTENMKKFFALAKENEELSEKIKNGFTKEELTALAEEQGITLTEEDFTPTKKIFVNSGTELSDEELNDATGGEKDGEIGLVDDSMYAAYFKCSNCGQYTVQEYKGRYLLSALEMTYQFFNNCGHCYQFYTLTLDKIEKVT